MQPNSYVDPDVEAWKIANDPNIHPDDAHVLINDLYARHAGFSPNATAMNDAAPAPATSALDAPQPVPGVPPMAKAADYGLSPAPTLTANDISSYDAGVAANAQQQQAQREAGLAEANKARADMGLPPLTPPATQPPAGAAAPGQPLPNLIPVGAPGSQQAQVAPGQDLTPTQEAGSQLLQAEVQRALGSPGGTRVVPGGDRLAQFRLEHGPALTPEQEHAIRDQADIGADLTKRIVDSSAATQSAVADQNAQQADNLGNQLIDFKLGQQKAQQEVEQQRKQVDQLSEEAKYNPKAIWANKNAGESFLSVLGMLMMGASGHPEMVDAAIKDASKEDLDYKLRNRDNAKNKLDQLISQVIDPAARAQYEHGIKLKQAAFEMDAMAASMQSKELQQKAFLDAESIRQEAEKQIIDAQLKEQGTRTEQWVRDQARVVGGGETMYQAAVRIAKQTGKPFDQVIAMLERDKGTMDAANKKPGGLGIGGSRILSNIAQMQSGYDQIDEVLNKYKNMGKPVIIKKDGGWGATKDVQDIVADVRSIVYVAAAAEHPGNVPSTEEVEQNVRQLLSNNPDQVVAALEAKKRSIATNLKTLKSTVNAAKAGELGDLSGGGGESDHGATEGD